jgi:hypothetical protein
VKPVDVLQRLMLIVFYVSIALFIAPIWLSLSCAVTFDFRENEGPAWITHAIDVAARIANAQFAAQAVQGSSVEGGTVSVVVAAPESFIANMAQWLPAAISLFAFRKNKELTWHAVVIVAIILASIAAGVIALGLLNIEEPSYDDVRNRMIFLRAWTSDIVKMCFAYLVVVVGRNWENVVGPGDPIETTPGTPQPEKASV